MGKNAIVFNMYNVYVPMAEQFKIDYDLLCLFEHVKETDKYDWGQMHPRVTYADWIVCAYEKNNKLYCIDFEQCFVREVCVAEILQYNNNNDPVDHNGNVIDDSRLHGYCESDYCGESDDLSCYIYFKIVDEKA
jgi:hypothetical protein